MAKEWTQILPLSSDHRRECERLSGVSGSGWWRIQKGDIPSFVPQGIRAKLDGGVMVVSSSSSGVTYLMFAAERVDPPAELDIQPFGMAVFSSGASTGMALIHHGGWPDRTTPYQMTFGASHVRAPQEATSLRDRPKVRQVGLLMNSEKVTSLPSSE